MSPPHTSEAHTLLRAEDTPLLITCEHASARIPEPLRVSGDDRPWLDTHWAWDIGAATLCRVLLGHLGGAAILARFSRLVCDANRSEDDETLILERVEDHTLSFNRDLGAAERHRRLARYHRPFHAALRREARRLPPGRGLLLSVHSFTPQLGGRRRELELGVLYDAYEPLALDLHRRLSGDFRAELNAPYSGRDGLIESARSHGRACGLPYLELELRQDLLGSEEAVRSVGERLARHLAALPWAGAIP